MSMGAGLAVGQSLGLATGLALGMASGSSGSNVLPCYVLVVFPRDEYDFEKNLTTDIFINVIEVKEKNRCIESTSKQHNTYKFLVNRIEKRKDTYLVFNIKNSDGTWDINTFDLLRKVLRILSERQVKYEVYQ